MDVNEYVEIGVDAYAGVKVYVDVSGHTHLNTLARCVFDKWIELNVGI